MSQLHWLLNFLPLVFGY